MTVYGRFMAIFCITLIAVIPLDALIWSVEGPLRQVDRSGALALVAAFIAVMGTATWLRPRWRPTIATYVGWILAGAAWFTAVATDFSSHDASSESTSLLLAVMDLALSYAAGFKPCGDEQRQHADDQRLRLLIREEITAAVRDTQRI